MKPAGDEIREIVERALAEDLGPGDATSRAVVPADARGRATIVQKQPGVVFGLEAAAEAFRQAGAEAFDPVPAEGRGAEGPGAEGPGAEAFDPVPAEARGAEGRGAEGPGAESPSPGTEGSGAEGRWRERVPVPVAVVAGPARALLAGERTALNLLGHLSGIATLTARFVRAVDGTGVRILDTRKTTPGLRALEKRAVAAGGGVNHRIGLYDAILIKDNHIAIAGGVGEAVKRAREHGGGLELEVECADVEQVRAAIAAGAERLLLDNMSPEALREAVAVARGSGAERHGPVGAARESGAAPKLEASGGVTLENVAEVAATGVDFISVGALTHSAPALDLSMELESSG